MKKENLKIIYNEVVELHKYQQQGLDLMYNKLNWILVSDVVFLAALYSGRQHSLVVMMFVSLSVILVLFGFSRKKFKFTAKISKQLSRADDTSFLTSLIKKKREAFLANNNRVKNLELLLNISQWLLAGAILLQLFIRIIQTNLC